MKGRRKEAGKCVYIGGVGEKRRIKRFDRRCIIASY